MGCRVKGMTTQEYRASYDYRREYFKQNPGLFNTIWFCSQCGKPLFGKKNVVVDHIRPLNKGGLNHVSNCTACCEKCNSAKSDIVDGRMYKGYAFKIVETIGSKATKGVGAAAALGVGLTAGAVRGVTGAVTKSKGGSNKHRGKKKNYGLSGLIGGLFGLCFKLVGVALKVVTVPLRCGTILSRFIFLALYVLIIMHFLGENTTLLNAWIPA